MHKALNLLKTTVAKPIVILLIVTFNKDMQQMLKMLYLTFSLQKIVVYPNVLSLIVVLNIIKLTPIQLISLKTVVVRLIVNLLIVVPKLDMLQMLLMLYLILFLQKIVVYHNVQSLIVDHQLSIILIKILQTLIKKIVVKQIVNHSIAILKMDM